MALYRLTQDKIEDIATTSFAQQGIRERDDLQRLIRNQIDVVVPGGLVISEEFSNWDSSNRRIDLLVLDEDANLVVVELKRTEDGGHSELQAIRYAAMISSITFEQVVEAHRSYLLSEGIDEDPQSRILSFLDWSEPEEERFAQEVRIVLVSAEFSKELTTSVLWLNDQGIDIRCVRIKPYLDSDSVIIDVQQVIPLPEAQDYQVRVREKVLLEKSARRESATRGDINFEFWSGLLDVANRQTPLHANVSPSRQAWVGVSRRGLNMVYVLAHGKGRVELYINRSSTEENKTIFDQLIARRDEIEKSFGGTLKWERLDDKRPCRISSWFQTDGDLSDRSTWEQLQQDFVSEMIKLDSTLAPHVKSFYV